MAKQRWLKIGRWIGLFSAGLYLGVLALYLLLRLGLGDRLWWLAFLNNFAPYYFVPLIAVIPLVLLLRSRQMLLAMLPFVLIAVVWFGPRFMPHIIAHSPGTSLSLITFNIWGINQSTDAAEQWFRQMNAGVIVLQDIPPAYSDNGIPQLLDVYPYQFMLTKDERYWGNMILSKHPFIEAQKIDLEGDGTPSHQRVTLNINGKMLAIYNIHLMQPVRDDVVHLSLSPDNPFWNLVNHYDDSLRNDEIKRLLDMLSTETIPYIVAGDFNLSDYSMIYGDLAAVLHDTQREVGIGLGASWPVSEIAGMPRIIPLLTRIDYVWHSDGLSAVSHQTGPKLGSDHLPQHAVLAIK
jgi:endonuclease/exonuclease/phosphatase (EEP) superfamily protein YafD